MTPCRSVWINPSFRGAFSLSAGWFYGQSVGRRLSFSLDRYATVFKAEIMLSWPVSTKFNFRIGHKYTWVPALKVRRSWKLFRPSEQRLCWSSSAQRRWITSLPGMQWGYFGPLDMLEYEVMRSPMSSQGASLFWGFLDLSRPWESLDRIYEEGLVVGCSTSIGYDGEILAIPTDTLEN